MGNYPGSAFADVDAASEGAIHCGSKRPKTNTIDKTINVQALLEEYVHEYGG